MSSGGLSVLVDRLHLAMAASRLGRRGIAVLAIEVHERRGAAAHVESPAALSQEARSRIEACVERTDTVSEVSPLRFVILLERLAEGPFAIHIADRVVRTMRAPFGREPRDLVASVGVSQFPDDGESTEDLLRRAWNACEGARMGGGDLVGFCSGHVSEKAHRRLALERALVGVLERDELSLHYQPQVDVDERALVGVEALLRWSHPTLGMVSPGEFIPILEATGAIAEVGEWALGEACRQGAAWARGGEPIRVSVNVSAHQLADAAFPDAVDAALSAHDLPPALLEIELTESVLVEDPTATRRTLEALQSRGLRVAVDDFGTGYASLAYIRHFPMDTLKIDRAFVRGLPGDAEGAAITNAIIALGRSLRLELVAEGVETEAEQEFLRAASCPVIQGYLHAKPMPAADLGAWRGAHPWFA